MSFSVYDVTVPVLIHGSNVLDDYVDHAQALVDSKAWPAQQVFGARLAPDMLSFGEQISVLYNKVMLTSRNFCDGKYLRLARLN